MSEGVGGERGGGGKKGGRGEERERMEDAGKRDEGTFMFFVIQSQLWGTDGHLHAPRFFGTGKKSRPHRGQANLNFHDFFDQKPIMGNRWAPARASIFRDWKKIPTAPGTGQS